ncbi:MAG TPA: Coenzyme F420 hydrogenase/dehydrogenase, beta subunit C-terminal domain [Microbacterium sp.]|nr:Coenzyme F420 hydrogenase/dehydrogenase, beta subunit C-terminal domain [Microbacterium sp.]
MTSERERQQLDAAIDRVVQRNACIGCGLCTRLDTSLELELDADGFLRPHRTRDLGDVAAGAARSFEKSCPGCRVDAVRPTGSRRHPTMGSSFGVWEAWASDDAVRYRGSSGGALTALHGWLLDSGRASTIASASAGSDARHTVPVTITTKAAALAAAGSRYAPVGVLANPDAESSDAITAKPCEIAAIRAMASARAPGAPEPILLSFFCAGTSSQHATDDLLATLGVRAGEPLSDLWYRGRGWPGRFTVHGANGEASMSYEESWGGVLGPATHWRCKVCADGVGESADVVAADFWRVDGRGYPVFTEGAGSSALIARTERGREAVLAAASGGAIVVRPISMSALANVQPLQRNRRTSLFGRLLGSRLAGVRGPRYRGFRLWALALAHPLLNLRAARGTHARLRRSQSSAGSAP